MNPQDAIKDVFEHDPDFCYDCCAPLDECVCESDLSGKPATERASGGHESARDKECWPQAGTSPAQNSFPVPVLAELSSDQTPSLSGLAGELDGEARESIKIPSSGLSGSSRGGENSLQWPTIEEQIAYWILKDNQ